MTTHNRQAGTSRVWRGLAAAVCVLLLQTGVRTSAPEAVQRSAAGEVPRGTATGAKRKVVFIAGAVSHAYGSHDHWPGSRLLSQLTRFSGITHLLSVRHLFGNLRTRERVDTAS
jgi:hypothetical protein